VAAGYNYLWSGGLAAPNAAQAVGLCAGTFTLVLLDDNGCNVDTTFTLVDPPPFLIDLITTEGESCPGFCDGSLQVTAIDAASYQVNNGAPQGTSTFFGLCAGEVEVTATSVNGCSAVSTATVDPGSLVVASFEVDPMVASILTPTFNFANTSEGATNFLWSFGTQGISANSDLAFSYTFPEQAGEYDVCLFATNDEGCEDVACTRIVVELDFAVHVPNAFTPDGDGLNDEFRVVGDPSLNDNFRLEIFNRWGELLFTSLDITAGWDGRVQGNPAVQGVYVWQLAVRDPKTAEILSWRGHVTLVR
jgi:gliding motility-associated-like protein